MAARRRIILHIGYGKTGSSAIQSALARNHALLKTAGILYPEHAASEQARRGEITSGNVDPENWFEGQVIPIAREQEGYGTILFSNENLFHRFDEFLEKHRAYADAFDFEIILFVREPFEKLISAYQQSVKRRGFAGDISEFAEHDTDTIRAAEIARALEADGVPFRLFNYSALRREAPKALFEHLGVWELVRSGAHAEVGTVNRSLAAAELAFLRYVNQVFGVEFGSVIADALVHRLPDLASDAVPIDAETAKRVYQANAPAVAKLNALLPASDRLTLEPVPVEGAAVPGLSFEQVEVIRSVFPSALTYKDGVILRDIAMKYESGTPLAREDAVALMQYAQKARPHGRIIAGKLKEWRGN
jgi:hypothetical protein